MSSVDERIVELEFNNQQFESGVQTSISTLDRLKQSLNLGGAAEGLSGITKSAKSFSLAPISDSLQVVTDRFSAFGIIGDQILRKLTDSALNMGRKLLTAVPNQMITGGKNRAQNIEQARFQIKGLKESWDDLYSSMDKAVSGTAYGIDAAAKAASQLVASNVAVGDEMDKALRGISGVAAMTNSSYEDIAQIFTKVAGNGRLMSMELLQLSGKGLNVAATLGQAMGKTEQEIRDMVTKGKIDFKTFAAAMDESFGEHATKANETFSGSLSNIKASLSRMGQKFATPTFDALKDIFNELLPVMKQVEKMIQPIAGMYTTFVENATVATQGLLRSIGEFIGVDWQKIDKDRAVAAAKDAADMEEIAQKSRDRAEERVKEAKAAGESADEIAKAEERLAETEKQLTAAKQDRAEKEAKASELNKDATEEEIGVTTKALIASRELGDQALRQLGLTQKEIDAIHGVTTAHEENNKAIEKQVENSEELEKLAQEVIAGKYGNGEERRKALEELGYSYEAVQNKVNELLGIEKRYDVEVGDKSGPAEVIEEMALTVEDAEPKVKRMRDILDGLKSALSIVTEAGSAFYTELLQPLASWAGPKILDGFLNTLANAGRNITSFKKSLGENYFSNLFSGVAGTAKHLYGEISRFINIAKHLDGVKQFVATLKDIGNSIKAVASSGLSKVSKFFSGFGESLNKTSAMHWEGLYVIVNNLAKAFNGIAKVASNTASGLSKIIAIFGRLPGVRALGDAFKNLFEAIKDLASFAFGKVTSFFSSIGEASDGIVVEKWLKFYKVVNNIAQALANLINGALGKKDIFSFVFPKVSLDGLAKIDKPFAALQKIFSKITPIAKKAGSAIKSVFSSINWSGPGKAFNFAMIAGAVSMLSLMITNLKYAFDKITIIGKIRSSIDKVSGILTQVKKSLLTFQTGLNASSLKSIAVAIAILAGSLIALSLLSPENLAKGLIGLGALFAMLSSFVKDFTSLTSRLTDGASASIIKLGAGLIEIGIAVLLLTAAIKSIGSMDPGQLASGLIGVGVILFEMAAFIKGMTTLDFDNSTKGLIKLAFGMILMAVAVKSLAKTVVLLGSIDSNSLVTGLVGVGAIMLGLFAFISGLASLKLETSTKGLLKAAVGMILMAVAINSIAKAVGTLGTMDSESMFQGLLAIGAIIAALTASIVGMGLSGGVTSGVIQASIAMIVIAMAVNNIVTAVNSLGNMNAESLQQGILAVGALIGALTLAASILGTSGGSGLGALLSGASFILMAEAINVLAESIPKLGDVSDDSLLKGIAAIASSLLVMSLALDMVPNTAIVKAAGFVVMAEAINILSDAIMQLSGLTVAGMAKSITTLAASLFIILVAVIAMESSLLGAAAILVVSVALAVLTPVLIALGNVPLEALGVALLGISGAFMVLGIAGAVLGPLAGSIMMLSVAFALIGAGAALAGVGLVAISTGFAAMGGSIVIVIKAIIDSIGILLAGLIENAALIVKALTTLGSAILDSFNVLLPQLVDVGLNIILSILTGIAENIEPIIVMAVTIIVALVDALKEGMGMLVQAGIDLMVAFINGLANGIRDNTHVILGAVGNLLSALAEFLLSAISEVVAGIPGVGEKISGMLDGVREKLREKFGSGDGEEDGGEYLEGVEKGISDQEGELEKVVEETTDEALTAGIGSVMAKNKPEAQIGLSTDESKAQMVDDIESTVEEAGQEALANTSSVEVENEPAVDVDVNTEATGETVKDKINSTIDEAVEQATSKSTEADVPVEFDASEAAKNATEKANSIVETMKQKMESKMGEGTTEVEWNFDASTSLDNASEELDSIMETLEDKKSEASAQQKDFALNFGFDTSMTELNADNAIGSVLDKLNTSFDDAFNGYTKDISLGMNYSTDPAPETAALDIKSMLEGKLDEQFLNEQYGINLNLDSTEAESSAAEAGNSIVDSLKNTITGKFEEFTGAGKTMPDGVSQGIFDGIPTVTEAMNQLGVSSIDELMASVDANSPSRKAAEVGKYVDEGFAEGINENVAPVQSACMAIAAAGLSALRSYTGMYKAIGVMLSSFIVLGLSSKRSEATAAGTNLAKAFVNGFTSQKDAAHAAGSILGGRAYAGLSTSSASYNNAKDIGDKFANGFIAGIKQNFDDAYDAGKKLRQQAEKGKKDGGKKKDDDPGSIDPQGYRIGENFAAGIYKSADDVYSAAKNLNRQVVEALKNPLAIVNKILNDEIDTSITIRPVLDLSEIQNGSKAIDAILPPRNLNLGGITASVGYRDSSNDDVIKAINALAASLPDGGDTYIVESVSYEEGSNVADAVKILARAARMQRRA